MLQNQIDREQISHGIEQLSEMLDATSERDQALVQAGLHLFHKKKVSDVKMDGSSVLAITEDHNIHHEVEIHLDFIEISHCPCWRTDICEHQIAVLLFLYSHFEQPGEFVQHWKGQSVHSEKHTIQQTPQHLKVELLLTNSVENWIDYLESEYHSFLEKEQKDQHYFASFNKEYYVFRNLYNMYYANIAKTIIPEQPIKTLLFHLHAGITTFYKMLDMMKDETGISYQTKSSLQAFVRELIDEILDIIVSLGKQSFNQIEKELLKNSIQRFHDLLVRDKSFTYDRLFVFRVLWSNLLNVESWMVAYEKELKGQLYSETKRQEEGQENFVTELSVALAHFEFMRKNDTSAIHILSKADSKDIYYYTVWVKMLVETESWNRLEPWLDFVLTTLTSYLHIPGDQQLKQELVRYYLHCFENYAAETKEKDHFLKAMQQWLPFSYSYYNHHLLNEKQYRQWTELQLYIDAPLEHMDRETLKTIEKEERECLLPLYHIEVEKLIQEKNRRAYKDAVKHLRKLRTHYRKLKQMEKWDRYIEQLASKYKRLRALQEELKKGKGKLIDD